jgi:hypothetical protein
MLSASLHLTPQPLAEWSGQVDPGNPPTRALFDFVKYESWTDGGFGEGWTDEFDSFDEARWSKADWCVSVISHYYLYYF